MSDHLVRSILIDLLSVVIPNECNVGDELLPNKKLRLAKSNEYEMQKSRTVQDQKSAQIRVILDPKPVRPSQPSSVMGPPPPTGRPKFDVARKLAELQADRDHWKNLYLSSRIQTSEESQARLELQRNLEIAEQKLLEQSEFCHQMGSHLAEIVWSLSQSPQAISRHLKDDQMESLLMLIFGTLENFVPFASSSDPKNNGSDSDHPSRSVSEPETRLVVALSGCASNLAGCSDGRRFISGNPIGNDVTRVIANLVLTNLSNLPTPVEDKLHRLALGYLYNLTLNSSTIEKVLENENSVRKIEQMSKNVLSPFQKMSESVIKRLNLSNKNVGERSTKSDKNSSNKFDLSEEMAEP